MTSTDRATHRPLGTARARIGQLAGAFLIDTGVVAAFVACTVTAGISGVTDLAILAGMTLAGFIVWQVRSWSRTGSTLGSSITGVRQVTTFDGASPGFDRAFGPTWFADVRNGRDPAQPESTVAPAPTRAAGRTPDSVPLDGASARSTSRALLVIDGRVSGAIGAGVVLGRNPTASGGERAISVADIGREISKVHLSVRVDDAGRVWAVDRKSTNGSTITRRGGVTQHLAPGNPVELTAGDVVHIGNHTVAVQFVTEVRVATR